MKNDLKKRIILIGIFLIIFLISLITAWKFSSETGTRSNALSMSISTHIINYLDKYFDINRGDIFWRYNFNEIVRKIAHFTEYFVIGSSLCIFLNLVFNRILPAAVITFLLSPVFGLIDEYHQKFTSMRTPRIFDICIDTAGVLTGMVLITVFFLIFNYISELKRRIRDLEQNKNWRQ